MKKYNKNKNSGFTLIELIVVITIIAILAAIAIPQMLNYVKDAQLTADKATVRSLNAITYLYQFNCKSSDPFENESNGNDDLMQALVDADYIPTIQQPQSKDAAFSWDFDTQAWLLYINDTPVIPSSPENTFENISLDMIR